jgi:protein TonB
MRRTAYAASVLLHGAIVAALVVELPRRFSEPEEPPGLEVILGALQAPGTAAVADDPPPAIEPIPEPPAPQALQAPPPVSPPAPPPPLPPMPEAPAVAALAELPVPPPLPPPPPRPAAPRATPSPPVSEAPVVRPLLSETLAAAMAAPPGTGTEGELTPVREVPGIRNPPPVYPEAARQRGQQGAVGVRLRIDEDGSVLRLEVIESSGHPLLDQAVIEALRRWRFAPATQGGRPVAADFLHRTIFRLD